MKKKLLLLTLLCFSVNVFAVTWIEIIEAEVTIYVDVDNIRKNRGFVFYSSLANTSSMGLNSVIVKNKVDCGKEKVIKLNVTYYGQPMGLGISYEEENTTNEVIYPKPNSTSYAVMKFACKRMK
jgi:hypothetical protein